VPSSLCSQSVPAVRIHPAPPSSHCEPMLGGGITFVESRGFVAWQELAASDRTTGTGGSNPFCSVNESLRTDAW
jgi:hypothetical protein